MCKSEYILWTIIVGTTIFIFHNGPMLTFYELGTLGVLLPLSLVFYVYLRICETYGETLQDLKRTCKELQEQNKKSK